MQQIHHWQSVAVCGEMSKMYKLLDSEVKEYGITVSAYIKAKNYIQCIAEIIMAYDLVKRVYDSKKCKSRQLV